MSRFYALLGHLSGRGQQRLLGECTGRDDWPRRGMYFFTESGQDSYDPAFLDVVEKLTTDARHPVSR